MDYYHKYIKYKMKYDNLKNKMVGGANDDSYQTIVYEIAKYLKPKILHKFKKDFGLKQVSNQVIELDKVTYLSELKDDITKYYITDKIDGKRTILYLDKNKSYAVNDKLTNIDINTDDICILDTEYYDNNYYIFDVMVYNGLSLINMPFEERMEYFDKFANIKTKPFVRLTDDYKNQIKQFKKEKKPYDIDGIIFTPFDGKYDTMKVFKYKPADKLTIDFLIKKSPNQNDDNNKTLYYLFCGIKKRMFFKLRMRLLKSYEDIFKNIDTKKLPQYFPIQFEPSSNKHAYSFKSDNEHLDNKVGEFLYNIKKNKWTLKNIREDRNVDVERGNYFGNNYKVAEFIWMSRHDPLIIENDDNDNVYFQEHNNILQKASRNYNSFVKSELFNRFKNTEWTMDLASGKGQDLFRYATYNMKNVIFLEIDKLALLELISRKFLFVDDEKIKNNMNILVQNVDLLDNYSDNIKAISNVYNERYIDLIMCNFAFHYFVKNEESLENVCKLINHYLRKGGKFVFTAFNGNKIINLLENNYGNWMVKVGDKVKYEIRRKYSSDDLKKSIGQKIDVLLPFSNNSFYEEYLINIRTIENAFKKYNIVLETNNSFLSYINEYKGNLDDDDKTYVNLYHYYIFMKK